MEGIIIVSNKLYVSYSFLRSYKVSQKDLENWSCRKVTIKKIVDGQTFVLFDSIPEKRRIELPSKIDLIAEYHLQQHENKVDAHLIALNIALTDGYIKHREPLKAKYPTLENKKINKAAKLLAVWTYIIDEVGCDVAKLYNAFNKVYPNKYGSYNSFANAKSKATKNGAEFMAIDQRWFTTPLNIKVVSVVNKFWSSELIKLGNKYSNRIVWKKLGILCSNKGLDAPSLSWIGKYRNRLLESDINAYESRYGREVTQRSQQPFVTMEQVPMANSQWQLDGKVLSVYVTNKERYEKYTMVIVMDSHSRKIVGHAVGSSENTIVIMAALRNAVTNTGYLPKEILTDNHSFNQTKEAAYFKSAIAEIGTEFTVTSNPQWKSLIECHNKQIDKALSEYYGFTGIGIKSKSNDAQPKQELLNEFGKNQYSDESVKALGVAVVNEFNDTILAKFSKTPNALYDESSKDVSFIMNLSDRIKVLTPQTEMKVSRGQITIKRGQATYEYLLPVNLFSSYNNKTVKVRYEDLGEGIYLYEKDTDLFITDLMPKTKINGSKAHQTESDIEEFYKNKGRLMGIKAIAKKKSDQLEEMAKKINPNVHEELDKVKTPKHIMQELEKNAHLRREVEDLGINIKTMEAPNKVRTFVEPKSTTKKPNTAPFAPKNHVMKKYQKNDYRDL